jgi:hypothetical protein
VINKINNKTNRDQSDRITLQLSEGFIHAVVEFVLYHELLHKHHGVKLVNRNYMAHTPEFRRSEQQFYHYQQAMAWIEKSL